jgi:hypothetical protein
MTKMAIFQQLKRNARNNLKKMSLKAVLWVEAILWTLIALAWIVSRTR